MFRTVLKCLLTSTLVGCILPTKLEAAPPSADGPVAHVKGDPKTVIPDIALIMGIRIGCNGRDLLEYRIGHGTYSISGHSNGRETWRTNEPRGEIDTDGFEYNSEGEVITEFKWVLLTNADRKVPAVRALPSKPGWLGRILPGMTEAQVKRSLPPGMNPPTIRANEWTWTATGFVRPNAVNYDTYTIWKATLIFSNKVLVEVDLNCTGGLLEPGRSVEGN